MAFINSIFRTHTGWGNPPKIKTNPYRRKLHWKWKSPHDRMWKEEWNEYFTRQEDDSDGLTALKEYEAVLYSYNKFLQCLTSDLSSAKKKELYTPGFEMGTLLNVAKPPLRDGIASSKKSATLHINENL